MNTVFPIIKRHFRFIEAWFSGSRIGLIKGYLKIDAESLSGSLPPYSSPSLAARCQRTPASSSFLHRPALG
ncbi:MAG: hypothetical protein E7I45_08010, partial [Eikenella corrodens]|uniref:hypothetical protein n=1 Tax=Eikenella corrodens TaxID=539 RepID=UPI00290C7A09